MASRDEDFGADLALIEVDDGTLSSSGPAPARETRDWRSLYEAGACSGGAGALASRCG